MAVDAAISEEIVIATGAELIGCPSGEAILIGPDSRQQLVVSGKMVSGEVRDLTRKVEYRVDPTGIVTVDPTGFIEPLANGEATVSATATDGASATVIVRVGRMDKPLPINFSNEVVPVLSKYGCNSGGCHGKAGGQNGFRLSLFGYEPAEDYQHLVKEGRGRRLFPAAPERSLLLLKSTGGLPHGGGIRFENDSYAYNVLRRWIAQGMPYGTPEDAKVVGIEVYPKNRVLRPGQEQQLVVTAHYTDGSHRDVTRTVQYESNQEEMAEVSPSGLVKAHDAVGEAAVMIRFQEKVAVFRATIPLGAPVVPLPEPRNFIDEFVFAKLKKLGMPPSELCDDASFVRRAAVDIAGRLPTAAEVERFKNDPGPDKRDRWIEELLQSSEYADWFANKWSALLRNKQRRESYRRGTYTFHSWIREALHQNVPFDEFVRRVIAASGQSSVNPAVGWYREVRTVEDQVQDTAQLFLGVRLQCARCHHHPFEKWSQQDYYGFAAYFTQVARKKGTLPDEEVIFHNRGIAKATNPRTKEAVMPTALGGPVMKIVPEADPRDALAAWITKPDNPFFSRMLVNRYWKHFFGRGLVEPEDDMRVTNPATNPELLEALSSYFIESGYDLKALVRTITQSRVYQLSAIPNEYNGEDNQNFSRYYPKRLQAEVLLDGIDQITGAATKFQGLPLGTRAVQLPDDSFNSSSYFLAVFGRPEMSSACECERTQDANLAQTLHLLNSKTIQEKVGADQGRAAILAKENAMSDEEEVRELYRWAFAREPLPEELVVAIEHLNKRRAEAGALSDGARKGYEDIIWALVNTKEFLFNH